MELYDKYIEYVSNELNRLIRVNVEYMFECDGEDYMYWPDDEEIDTEWDH